MLAKEQIAVGGQAVIEGVMMRGPKYIATAVRRADGTIEVCRNEFTSITKKNKFLGLPLIRGFVSLIEMMIIGVRTLNFSAQRWELDFEDESKKKKSKGREKLEEILNYIVAFGLAILLFAFLPYKLADMLDLGKEHIFFNAFAGVIRIVFFVVYIFGISLLKDIRRVFEYHGAEHCCVHTYEKDDDLTAVSAKKYTTLHPRCGTSFIFFVLLLSILIFSVVDTLVAKYLGYAPNIFIRLGYHFLLMPLVSGISYEVLRLSGKKADMFLVKLVTVPGMMLQKITTQPPSLDQLEVAMTALKYAMEFDIPADTIILKDCNNDSLGKD